MRPREIHAYSLATSTDLAGFCFDYAIAPLEVVRVLNDAHVSFVLIGTHALGGWMRKPRTTDDVDVIVSMRHQRKAIAALLTAFNQLEVKEEDAGTQLLDCTTKKLVIDVHSPDRPLFKAVLKNTKTVRYEGQRYRIPSLEMAVILRFAPMISPIRSYADKYQDAHDFISMVKANPEINLAKLAELGEMVFPGGGSQIVETAEQVRLGKKLKF